MKKILIIEDDRVISTVYRNRFKMEGFDVIMAADGEEGLTAIQTANPDVVLLDLMLPKISGIEILRTTRTSLGMESLPIVVFTNAFQHTVLKEVRALKANDILIKSNVTAGQVVQAVNNALSRAEAGDGTSFLTADSIDPAIESAFNRDLPESVAKLRKLLVDVNKCSDEEKRPALFGAMQAEVHTLTGRANLAGMPVGAWFCDAFEVLLQEMATDPAQLTPSCVRTVTQACDFLTELFRPRGAGHWKKRKTFNILVVDDDALSRRAINVGLAKLGQQPTEADQPAAALELLQGNVYHLVLLDVEMPGMTGFSLCSRLRQLPDHKDTPVIFVTSSDDFQSRAKGALAGGTDFIAKPFFFLELAVKSLIHLLRHNQKA